MRLRLAEEARRMNELLEKAGLKIAGGTSLFTLVRDERAGVLFEHLGRQGILVRIFDERPDDMRFGLPGSEAGGSASKMRCELSIIPRKCRSRSTPASFRWRSPAASAAYKPRCGYRRAR